MENASKALIIAGAILLAILLISLGIMVFNQASDTVANGGMSQAEITTFNSQFTKYEGTIRGSQVKSLISEVRASNASDASDGTGRGIILALSGTGVTSKTDTTTGTAGSANYAVTAVVTSGDIASSGQYTVAVDSYDTAGYISRITITKK